MRIFKCLIIGLVIFLSTAASAQAQINPRISYDYYPVPYVKGVRINELVARSSPLASPNGRTASGLTRWTVSCQNPTFAFPKIDVCRVEKPGVSVQCLIILPQLQGGDAAAGAEFAQFLEKVKIHEQEHCRIATEYANVLADAFTSMKPQDCKDITKTMHSIYSKTLDDCVVAQNRFDHAEYGYSHYLMAESMGRMSDAGFNVLAPSAPRSGQTQENDQTAPAGQTVLPSPGNLTVVPEGTSGLEHQGFYKDENGVWRNY